VLTSTAGWRWVFWINLPMVAVVAVAAALALRAHASRPPAAVAPLNFVGPLLLSLTVLPLLLTAADARLALLTVIPAALFVWHERRTPAPVFTHRPVSLAATVASATAGAAFLGSEVYLPLQIQVGFGDPVWVVAIALVAATLGWTTGSVGAARMDVSPADQILVGTSLVFVATLVMAVPAGGALLPIAAYGFAGLGMGIASPALFAVVLADGREGREGQSTSAVPLARQVGAGLGTALVGVVFTLSLSQQTIHAAEQAGAHVPDVVPAVRLTYLVAAVLGGIGVIACRWLREPSRRVVSDLT